MQRSVNVVRFIVIAACLNVVLYHFPLYAFALSELDASSLNGVLTLVNLTALALVFTLVALFVLFMVSARLAKAVCILFALVNSVAVYFMVTFKVILDYTMMGNILNTQTSEASSYWNLSILVYFVLLGVVPGIWLWRLHFKPVKRITLLLLSFVTVSLCVVLLYANSSSWLWFDKHSKAVGGQIMPWSYVVNTIRFQRDQNAVPKNKTLLPDAVFIHKNKKVVVLIIGETARLKNFSLYGYARETNPLLAKSTIIALNDPDACSTYTTKSIACMLSHLDSAAPKFEPLPSYLQRQGVEVIWHSKNWGEPAVSVDSYQDKGDLKQYCKGEGCEYDEVLLTRLRDKIAASTADKIFVVLHTKGSHGPSYFSQYPPQFERFTPVCKTVDLSQCSFDALQNAYDNSILYTDFFINETIQLLQQTGIASSLLYISDHGESLGEGGYYLHGTPMVLAPDEQVKIPFLVWMSDEFVKQKGIDVNVFKQAKTHSHANVFHSVMGALDLRSDIYKPELDVFEQE